MGGVLFHGVLGVEHRRQHLVAHVDEGQGLLGDMGAGGRHRRYRMPAVEGLLPGQDVPAVEAVVDHGPFLLVGGPGGGLRQIGCGDHALDPRQGQGPAGVDGLDAGVSMGAAQKLAVEESRHLDIGAVPGTARHLVEAVMADRSGAHHVVLLG